MYNSGSCFATIPCLSFREFLELNKVHCTRLAGISHCWGLAVCSVLTPSLVLLAPHFCFTHKRAKSWGSWVAVQSHTIGCPRLEFRVSVFGSCTLGCCPALVPMFIRKLHFSLSVFYNAFSRCTPLSPPPQALVLQMYTAILDPYFLLMSCAHLL